MKPDFTNQQLYYLIYGSMDCITEIQIRFMEVLNIFVVNQSVSYLVNSLFSEGYQVHLKKASEHVGRIFPTEISKATKGFEG